MIRLLYVSWSSGSCARPVAAVGATADDGLRLRSTEPTAGGAGPIKEDPTTPVVGDRGRWVGPGVQDAVELSVHRGVGLIAPIASSRPRCASEVTSATPLRPRAVKSGDEREPAGAVLSGTELQKHAVSRQAVSESSSGTATLPPDTGWRLMEAPLAALASLLIARHTRRRLKRTAHSTVTLVQKPWRRTVGQFWEDTALAVRASQRSFSDAKTRFAFGVLAVVTITAMLLAVLGGPVVVGVFLAWAAIAVAVLAWLWPKSLPDAKTVR
jgi:hypothetical protein